LYSCDLHTKKVTHQLSHELEQFLSVNKNTRKFYQRYSSSENYIWLLSESGQLAKFNSVKSQFKLVARLPEKFILNKTMLRCIGSDSKGRVYFGPGNGGLLMYDTSSNGFEIIEKPFELPNENRLAEVYSFMNDASGIFWITTRSGLYKLSPELNKFQNYTIKSKDFSVSYSPNITCFYRHRNKIWIGSESRNILFNQEANSIAFRKILKNGRDTSAAYFFNDSKGNVYVNTFGIFHFDPVSGSTKEIEATGDSVSVRYFREGRYHRILLDRIEGNEVWWLAGWRYPGWGLYLYNTFTKVVRRFEFSENGKPFNPVSFRGIQKDKYGNIWVGTEGNGLIRLNDFHTGEYTIFRHLPGDSLSFPSSIIMDITKDATGNIWVITGSSGIVKIIFDKNGNPVFETFSGNAGLRHLALYDALADNNNNIWISSSAGLEKFNTTTRTFSHYGFEHGIFNPQLATGCHQDADGNFYFSSWFTFIRFHPDSFIRKTTLPLISIRRLYVMNRDSSELLTSKHIHIPYSKNSISFLLEAINHLNPAGIRYKYKLVGFDNDWIEAGNRNYISYTDLSPGSYTFMFTASNNENEWNPEPVIISFTILTPWYRTWWFIALLILAITAGVFILFRYRLNQKIKIYTVRQRLHRDLHDDVGATLSSVKAYSEILKDNPDNPVIAELIKDNAAEMIERLEVIAWATNPVHDNFGSLKNRMIKFITPLCHAKKMSCKVESKDIDDGLDMPGEFRQNIFLVFKEAVNNTIKYADATDCSASMLIENRNFILQISDNGRGSDGTVKGSGTGWKNMQKRAEELKGQLKIASVPEKGTTITFSVPYPFKIPNTWDNNRNGKI
jgi:streptogramin lyase/two-component sensor histidine kinase